MIHEHTYPRVPLAASLRDSGTPTPCQASGESLTEAATPRKATAAMSHDTRAARSVHDLVLVERLDDADPLFRYRVTCGDFHAVGPTEEDAMATLERAMRGAS